MSVHTHAHTPKCGVLPDDLTHFLYILSRCHCEPLFGEAIPQRAGHFPQLSGEKHSVLAFSRQNGDCFVGKSTLLAMT
jgi:hypothetical protein